MISKTYNEKNRTKKNKDKEDLDCYPGSTNLQLPRRVGVCRYSMMWCDTEVEHS